MPDEVEVRRTLSEPAARQLANATKTRAQMGRRSRRAGWFPSCPGYRSRLVFTGLNKVKETGGPRRRRMQPNLGTRQRICRKPSSITKPTPREYFLNAVTTVLDVQTRVSDLYNQPYDQIQEQLRLLIEKVKERQESELIYNADYGLLTNAAPSMKIPTRRGPPTPDDLDELIAKVWKEPAFFLAHPRAIAAFGRECTQRVASRRQPSICSARHS